MGVSDNELQLDAHDIEDVTTKRKCAARSLFADKMLGGCILYFLRLRVYRTSAVRTMTTPWITRFP